MNSTQRSLAARVHAHLKPFGTVWHGTMSPEQQAELFSVELVDRNAVVVVRLLNNSTIHTTVFDTDRTLLAAKYLSDIQQMVEDRHDRDMGYEDRDDWDHDFIAPDFYRSFPRDDSAFVKIENKALGRKEETVDVSLDNARNNFARRHGYDDWAEMRALAPEGDRDEDWVVEWTDGTPEESRLRQIAHLEAEAEELSAKLRDGRQGQLGQTFLNKQAGLFDFALKNRDPEAYRDLEEECHALRERHLAAVEANRVAFDRYKDVQWLLNMYRRPDEDAA